MNTAAPVPFPATAGAPTGRRWYREPYVWLVLGGPLVVIAASIVTVVLAVKNPDPVLQRKPTVQVDPNAAQRLTPEERAAAELSLLPAGKARNHVVSPTLPQDQ